MYTLLVNGDNEIIITNKERIMQRSKLMNKLHFLVDKDYSNDEHDMRDFSCLLEYITPIGRQYRSELLVQSEELYEDKYVEYILPVNTDLTAEFGQLELQLTFVKVIMKPDGSTVQYVRKTSPTSIEIVPIAAWADIIPDSALTSLDQKIIELQALASELEDISESLDQNKADDIRLQQGLNGAYLSLLSNGNEIGNKVMIDDVADEVANSQEAGRNGLVTMLI